MGGAGGAVAVAPPGADRRRGRCPTRARDQARRGEPADARATAEDLAVQAVVHGFDRRNELVLRVRPFRGVGDGALVDDGRVVSQSLAILEFLEEHSREPALLPKGLHERAYVRALAQVVACEIHPLNNVRVLHYLEQKLEASPEARSEWYRHWVADGLAAL